MDNIKKYLGVIIQLLEISVFVIALVLLLRLATLVHWVPIKIF